MLILLPPSETKHPGGAGAPLSLDSLALPSLRPEREALIEALVTLAGDEEAAARVLKLSAKQRGEIAHNLALRVAPTMPAIDRYTGVLFDALAAQSLEESEREWLGRHVMIHSAPFGPVGALDPVPTYRLGAQASLPGLKPLKRFWADAVSTALAAHEPSFVLDLRSEAYAALGPIPDAVPSVYVRVVSAGADGVVRALNHFNKKTKGEIVRALACAGSAASTLEELRRDLMAQGIKVEDHAEEWRVFARL